MCMQYRMYFVMLPCSLRWQPFSLQSQWSPTKGWVECFHNSSMEDLSNDAHQSDHNPNKNFDQIHAKELVSMTVYHFRKYSKLKGAFAGEETSDVGETKIHQEIWLGWPIQGYFFIFFINIFMISNVNIDQCKVTSLFFSSIYLWYPRSILTKARLFLYFFHRNIYDIQGQYWPKQDYFFIFSFIYLWYLRSILTNPRFILPLTIEWHFGFATSHTLPLTWCQNTESKQIPNEKGRRYVVKVFDKNYFQIIPGSPHHCR